MEKEQVEGELNLGDKKLEGIIVIWAYYLCNIMSNSC